MCDLADRLLRWYDQNKRSLPWRMTKDPYRVWLSEIMLQQTRVEAVKNYFARFVEQWPTIELLSVSGIDAVLKAWEGLGYYSRARNLHKTAQIITQDHGGRFPQDPVVLRKLPGIGEYTSAAIASICFSVRVPALDGNQARVLSRLTGRTEPLSSPFDLYEEAMQNLSCERPGDQNQAYMDLANAICLPRKPLCGSCPLADRCEAFKEGAPEIYPVRLPPAPKKREQHIIAIITTPDKKVYVAKRTDKELLGGLYSFPVLDGALSASETEKALEQMGFRDLVFKGALPAASHTFTHRIWEMQGYLFEAHGAPEKWLAVSNFDAYAIPSALHIYQGIAEQLMPGAIA